MRHPDGMGDVACHKEEGATRQFLGRIPRVCECLERKMGLVGRMDMEAWASGFNGYAKE